MSINEIMLLIIIVIGGIFLVITIYFGYTFIIKKIKKKKNPSPFDSGNLIVEESLMNSMDEKRNIEYGKKDNIDTFTNADSVGVISDKKEEEKEINPFGVDLTKRTREGIDYVKEEEERSKRKYFK